MNLAIELLEGIAQHLSQPWDNLPQRILGSDRSRSLPSNTLTTAQIQTLLKLSSRWAVEAFL
ncbi:MAG: hypothetical protein ACPGVO_13965 [Spirulinaceae cyanobacterium]